MYMANRSSNIVTRLIHLYLFDLPKNKIITYTKTRIIKTIKVRGA